MTELRSFDLPVVDPEKMEPETALDQLESSTLSYGQKIMRHLLEQQWVDVDEILAQSYELAFPPWDCSS